MQDIQPAATTQGLGFPYEDMPAFGELRQIADGILWTRLPLPYQLDHVNIYPDLRRRGMGGDLHRHQH